MGFQHAAELLRLVTQSDLYTLVVQMYIPFSVLSSIYHTNVLQETLHLIYNISTLQEIFKRMILKILLLSF